MPYRSIAELPPAFKNFTKKQKRWVLPVLNALLRIYDEGKAIRIAIGLLKKHFGLKKARPKAKQATDGNK